MKKSSLFRCRLPAIVLLLAFGLIAPGFVRAQWVYNDPNFGNSYLYVSSGGICSPNPQGKVNADCIFHNFDRVDEAYSSIDTAFYVKARQGTPVTISVWQPSVPWNQATFDIMRILYSTSWTNWGGDWTANAVGGPLGIGREFEFTFTPPVATEQGFISLSFYWVPGTLEEKSQIVIPIIVEGTKPTPILGYTVQPQVPQMVLHDPPGDGSFSEFQQGKKVCRGFETSLNEGSSVGANLGIKLGIAGSAGIFVTTDFEFSTTITAGFNMKWNTTTSNNYQTCLDITENIKTSDLPGDLGDGSDIFIGFGTDLAYGVLEVVRIDTQNCNYSVEKGLVFAPVGAPRKFVLTAAGILEEIAELQPLVNDNSKTEVERNNVQNQIDVWNQVLALNDWNKAQANEPLGPISFDGGGSAFTQSATVTMNSTQKIFTEMAIESTVGLEFVLEAGGSGVNGSLEFGTTYTYGASTTNDEETSKLISYTLTDDDPGDKFSVDVVRDSMFGTPIFRLKQNSKSSCPYEGGFQRDQPKLKIHGQAGNSITLDSTPLGTSAIFMLDLCNESNEERIYYLKLNASSNLNGAVVSAAGVPLNGNDQGQSYPIQANDCKENLVVEVKMLSPSSPQAYPNLELFLYAPCDEVIQSSVFASVYFGNASGVEDPSGSVAGLSVYPNPVSGPATVDFRLKESGPVVMRVYDLLGCLHSAASLDMLPSGEHTQEFDAQLLPSGVYLLEILAPGGRAVKRFVVE